MLNLSTSPFLPSFTRLIVDKQDEAPYFAMCWILCPQHRRDARTTASRDWVKLALCWLVGPLLCTGAAEQRLNKTLGIRGAIGLCLSVYHSSEVDASSWAGFFWGVTSHCQDLIRVPLQSHKWHGWGFIWISANFSRNHMADCGGPAILAVADCRAVLQSNDVRECLAGVKVVGKRSEIQMRNSVIQSKQAKWQPFFFLSAWNGGRHIQDIYRVYQLLCIYIYTHINTRYINIRLYYC